MESDIQHPDNDPEQNPRESRMEWLQKIVEQTAPLMNDGRTLKEIMDELYDDETGLPK